MGCLAFIILAVLGFALVLVLGPVFAISDAIKWLLAWLGTVLPWAGGAALIFVLVAYFAAPKPEEEWERLHKPENEQEKKRYWHLIDNANKNLVKEDYLKWLHKPENAEKLEEYESFWRPKH